MIETTINKTLNSVEFCILDIIDLHKKKACLSISIQQKAFFSCKIFSFVEESFEGPQCTGKQTASHRSGLPL